MFKILVLCGMLAAVSAAPSLVAPLTYAAPALPATLLPKVAVTAPVTTVVKQPVVVQEPQPIVRTVPVPIKAVSYAAPTIAVAPAPVIETRLASPIAPSIWGGSLVAPLAAPGFAW